MVKGFNEWLNDGTPTNYAFNNPIYKFGVKLGLKGFDDEMKGAKKLTEYSGEISYKRLWVVQKYAKPFDLKLTYNANKGTDKFIFHVSI